MPEVRPLPRVRLKSTLIGAVGGALILLPLGEVLRQQGAELVAMGEERALLDPLAHAVAVQRGLIGHHEVADRVLRGRQTLEGERRLRHARSTARWPRCTACCWPVPGCRPRARTTR